MDRRESAPLLFFFLLLLSAALRAVSVVGSADAGGRQSVAFLPTFLLPLLSSVRVPCAKCSRHVVIRHVRADPEAAAIGSQSQSQRAPRTAPTAICRAQTRRPSPGRPAGRSLSPPPPSHSGPHTWKEEKEKEERTKAKLFGSLSRSHVASPDAREEREERN